MPGEINREQQDENVGQRHPLNTHPLNPLRDFRERTFRIFLLGTGDDLGVGSALDFGGSRREGWDGGGEGGRDGADGEGTRDRVADLAEQRGEIRGGNGKR